MVRKYWRELAALGFGILLALAGVLLLEWACGMLLERGMTFALRPARRTATDVKPGKFEIPSTYRSLAVVNPHPPKITVDPGRLDKSQANLVKRQAGLAKGLALPIPSQHVRSILRERDTGKAIWDVHYTIDEFGRRSVPGQEGLHPARHLLFLGCSVTFGDGSEDSETLPYYVSELVKARYRTYNMGLGGRGPNDLLALALADKLFHRVTESRGVAVYRMIEDHISRTIGAMSYLRWSMGKGAYFYLDSDSRLVWQDDFQSGRPATSRFYELLNSRDSSELTCLRAGENTFSCSRRSSQN